MRHLYIIQTYDPNMKTEKIQNHSLTLNEARNYWRGTGWNEITPDLYEKTYMIDEMPYSIRGEIRRMTKKEMLEGVDTNERMVD